MAASEIDYFIREQKSKLARQRQQIRTISPRHSAGEIDLRQPTNVKENIPPAPPIPLERKTERRHYTQRKTEQEPPPVQQRVEQRRNSDPAEVDQPELPLVARLVEGELRHRRFEQQQRQDQQANSPRTAPRNYPPVAVPETEPEGVLIRDHGSARRRNMSIRNQEYNEFKRQEEEKFRNRFAQKKPPPEQQHRSRRSDFVSPRQPPMQQQLSPTQNSFVDTRPPQPQRQQRPPRQQYQDEFEQDYEEPRRLNREPSKLDELDRKVQELRQHKLPDRYDPQAVPLGKRDGEAYEPSFYPQDEMPAKQYRAPPPPRRRDGVEEMLDAMPQQRVAFSEESTFSLPLKERSTEDIRKREERNREYNDFLREKEIKDLSFAAEKRGWGSPVYDDLLIRKRQEERMYRKHDDPEYFPVERKVTSLPPTKLTSMLSNAEQQLRELDSQYDKSKVKVLSRRDHGSGGRPAGKMKGIIDDENYLGMAALDMIDQIPDAGRKYPDSSRRYPRAAVRDDDDDLSGLPLGRLNSDEMRRRKERYADDLRHQMEEQKQARQREKEHRRSPGPIDLNRSRSANDILGGYAGGPSAPGATKPLAGMPSYNTPADDAYFYYAAKDPLEDSGVLGDSLGSGGHQRSHSQPGDPSRRVRFDNSQVQEGFVFASEDERKNRLKQQRSEYAAELQRQMVDTQRKRDLKKREQAEYDRKKDEEIANYNPFGKGGGGAPLKDSEGNLIADLHRLQHGAQTSSAIGNHSQRDFDHHHSGHHNHHGHSPRDMHIDLHSHGQSHGHHRHQYSPPPITSGKDAGSARTPRQTNVHGELSHARGGHGIFGQALSEEDKIKSEKYKDELRIQIEEKRRESEYKKQQQRDMEDKEQRKLDEQQRRIQMEYEEELRKKREKEENARRANDEARKQAEDRKKDVERRRQEDETRENARDRENAREHQERESQPVVDYRQPVVDYRQPSPIIHERSRSPNVPAIDFSRRPSEGGQVVMSQLANMRRQLDAERLKVESALAQQRNHVEVYDPRLQQTNEIVVHGIKDPAPSSASHDVDVFEMVRNRQGPVPVRRAPSRTDPASDHIEQFRQLKQQHMARHHGGIPETPINTSTLEDQQAALLREQESEMRHGRKPENSQYASRMPGMNPRDLGMAPATRDSSQLQSDTAFLGMNGSTYDEPEGGQPSYDIARFETPAFLKQYGEDSSSTLDVDELARKNEERLRKLQRMQSDTVSLNDPEEVLNRFMDRQMAGGNERPPTNPLGGHTGAASRNASQRTLMDDSWLDPASRSS